MDFDPDQTVVNDAANNAPAPAQGTAPANSRPETLGQGKEAREAFLRMMSNWYTEYTRVVRRERPLVDKIRKQGAKEFRANKDDDPKRAEFWLENTIRVFDELSCTPEECLKCVVSLLRDSAYRWWNTLVSVVPRERKYISQRFINHKRKEFLELKQGRISVTDYEWEFVRLNKYARECMSTEGVMCKRFEDGLNEDIHLYIGVLELKEFVVLVDRACKAKELAREKRRAENESRDSRKRQLKKSHQSSSKKLRDFSTRSVTSTGFST
ncbi:maturase K [Gossypium australe]|uniref:Maturase K n=1 Tax=Gossypium australe TaxID=47621 RepID=A0A5B6WPK3_9ROSI|nr:maturase K [Gossypium australe]